jgi:hypothetical protein
MGELQDARGREQNRLGTGASRALDLDDRVRLTRPAGGFPAGSEGSVIHVWCAGRCLVELGPFDAPVVVEIDQTDVQLID